MKMPWSKARRPAAHLESRPLRSYSAGIGTQAFPWLSQDGFTAPGVSVSREQALSVTAVLRGRNLICGTIASLPVYVVDSDNNHVEVPLFRQLDPDVPNSVVMSMIVEDLLFYSISWCQVLQRGYDNYPMSIRHVDHVNITWQIPDDFPLERLPSDFVIGSYAFVAGEPVPARDIIRFDSPNPPLLTAAGRAIIRLLKLESAADMYASDPMARDFFTANDGADPDDGDVTDLLDSWKAARQQRATAFVPDGFTLNQIQAPTPADIQLNELIKAGVVAIANAMGIDSEDLNVSTTTRTYRNAVDRRQDLINSTFAPYVRAIEDRLSMGDVTRRGQRVCFEWDDFLRANPLERAQVQQIYKAIGAMTTDEIRYQEDMPALTDMQKLELAPPAPPEPQRAQPVAGAQQPQQPVQASYSSDSATGMVFDLGDLDATFAVDEARRTITGMVVPWNRTGQSGGRKWQFTPGSLKFAKSSVNRIKLLQDHDASQPVGFLARTWADEQGQFGTFKVARGEAGDAALQSAADGVRDGLSVGIGFEGDDASFSYAPHPQDDAISVVSSAPWRETSLVALPAFSDARTTAVQMSAANKGAVNMLCNKCNLEHEGACATAPQFDGAAIALAVKDAVAAEFAARDKPEGPVPVNPVRPEPVKVNEAPLYRFDGGKAQHSFAGDLAMAAGGDYEARKRLQAFQDKDMVAVFANISSTNTAELNPVPTRPELFVPQLRFPRPIGDQVTRGGLSDITAFIVPKYNSSSGLAGAHTPGTNPTDGAWDATGQTITPVGVSGQVTLNREVIDQGGNPQADQIIYSDMVKAYNELLEQRIVNMFQGLSLSDTAIVGVDKVLQAAMLSTFTALQFLRGGDRFNSLVADSTLYGALTAAVDDQGRSLFPMEAPVNAMGTAAGDLSSVRVGGKLAVPAWACESANGGDGKGYLWARESVYQWASAPTRFDFREVNVASVVLGIWGYSAEAITRSADIYQLAYAAA